MGWDRACSGACDCVITMGETKSLTATFTLNQYIFTTATDGNDSGAITLTPYGAAYADVTDVHVSHAADISSTFTGWAGACTGAGACLVTMDAAKSVTATFTLNQYILTTATDGNGSGALSLNPTGGTYDHGTDVTVPHVADTGSTFTGWAGACTGTCA